MTEHVPFVHLHNHSDFSLYDGFQKVESMANRAKELNMKAIALTDHGKCCGLVKFYKACCGKKGSGIKPILGEEFYIVDNLEDKKGKRRHLTVLAKNLAGYYNLIKLSTKSHKYMSYGYPRIDFDMLKDHSEGLIVMSGCAVGEFASAVIEDNQDLAKQIVRKYKEVFEDDYYLEIMWTDYDPQRIVIQNAIKYGKEFDIKVIVSNDTHYTHKNEAEFQRVKIALSQNTPIQSTDKKDTEYYIKSYDEMCNRFKKGMQYLHNTMEIEEKCNVELELGVAQLPHFEIPKDNDDYNKFKQKIWNKTEDQSYLMFLAEEGLKKRGLWESSIHRERLYKELETIRFTGYDKYLLIVHEFCDWTRKHGRSPIDPDRKGLILGCGRGSAAGCLVLYSLGVTGLDPIKYDLTMDRFLFSEADYRAKVEDFFELKDLEDKVKIEPSSSSCELKFEVDDDLIEEEDDDEEIDEDLF